MRDEGLDTMFEYGHPWLRQLREGDKAEKPWGYVLFINPQWKMEDPDHLKTYDLKRGNCCTWLSLLYAVLALSKQVGTWRP